MAISGITYSKALAQQLLREQASLTALTASSLPPQAESISSLLELRLNALVPRSRLEANSSLLTASELMSAYSSPHRLTRHQWSSPFFRRASRAIPEAIQARTQQPSKLANFRGFIEQLQNFISRLFKA